MKFNEIINETTAGAVATVAMPLGKTQKRGGNLLTGKKTNKKYANSVYESKMKQLAMDLKDMDNGNFQKKYKKSKEQMKLALGDPHAKKTVHENVSMDLQTKKQLLRYADAFRMLEVLEKAGVKVLEVRPGGETTARFLVDINGRHHLLTMNKVGQLSEAHLEEDDLILVPGQGHRLKSGFIPHDKDRTDHEVEMAKSDLFQAAKNAKTVYELIADVSEDEGLEGWVQEKIIKANDYLNTVREYLEHKMLQNETAGVIAGGGVGESLANWQMGVQSIPRTTEWKRKAITAVMPGAMGKEYTFDTEQEAIQHFGKDAWEKIKAGVPTKSGKPWEVIYADDVTEGKGLWANIHAKRERIKHGSGEHMRKPGSKGAPSAQDFKDAAKEGVGEKIKGAIRREKAKDLPLIQTRRDYASMQAGDAYEKGQTRKGNQYMAWAERDRKKKGDRTTNPAGTYRTKTSDYTNEGEDKQGDEYKAWRKKNFNDKKTTDKIVKGSDTRTKYDLDEAQSMGAALKNTLAKAEPGSKLDNSIKSHNRHIKAGLPGTLKNAPTGYHFDSKGYCRLGDK